MIQQSILSGIEAEIELFLGNREEAISLCNNSLKTSSSNIISGKILEKAYIAGHDFKKANQIRRVLNNYSIDSVSRKKEKSNTTFYKQTSKFRNLRRISINLFLSSFFTLLIFSSGIVVIPALLPEFSSEVAERTRNITGAGFITGLEELSYSLADFVNQVKYQIGDEQQLTINVKKTDSSVFSHNRTDMLSDSLLKNGWAVLKEINSTPVLFIKKINPDSEKKYARTAVILARMDLLRLDFTNSGKIPAYFQNERLVGAFNGGFRTIHGRYGLLDNGNLFISPKNNIGTILIYNDNRIEIKSWETGDIIPEGVASFRQNCPLIIDSGSISPEIKANNMAVWGFTVDNVQLTWRSGVGLSNDGRFLLFAVGKSLSVTSLAISLLECGAYNAIQLDINKAWTKFVTYTYNDKLIANKAVGETSVTRYQYLFPANGVGKRDLFYLSAK